MTLDELDAEARMHGLHVWESRKSDHPMARSGFYCVTPDKGTLDADSIESMAAKLRAYTGHGQHAAGPMRSKIVEQARLAKPYIGRRRADG